MSVHTAKAKAPSLRRLQEWMTLVMRHPATADVAVRSKQARQLFSTQAVLSGAIVKPNARMSVTQRLQVYNGGYLARLEEVLASDYGALQYLLGHDAWHRLCARYVDRHPSRHPNLNQFGKHMPAFVKSQRELPHHAFAIELATLERCISDAFDAPPSTPVAPEALATIAPDDWPRARIVCNPSLRLCAFRQRPNAFYIAFKEGQSPPPPKSRSRSRSKLLPTSARSHVAVFRRDYRVFRLDLEPAAHAVLSALQRGMPLSRALQRADGGDVGRWFQVWSADGLFSEVRIAARNTRR